MGNRAEYVYLAFPAGRDGFDALRDILEERNPGQVVLNVPLGADHDAFDLAKSLCIMAKCDHVFMADGWEEDRACTVARVLADAYGMDILNETEV